MTPIVDSGFHIVGGREVHYRRTGTEGPAVVLVHAFPWSSETLTPLLEMAPRICTVFAVDAPGYGLSEALGGADPDITDYATALDETLASLGVEQFALYGVHSGALVAAALAAQAGSRVTNIVLDGLPLWTTDERAELERRFFPRLEPAWDGSHIVKAWSWCRDQHMFQPWYRKEPGARIDKREPDAGYIDRRVVEMLRAGSGYRSGFEAAFRFDIGAALERIVAPLTVVSRRGDLYASHARRLAGGIAFAAIEDEEEPSPAVWRLVGDTLPPAPAPAPPNSGFSDTRSSRTYVPTSRGGLLARSEPGRGRPLVMLHASPTSSVLLLPLMRELRGARPIVSFDTLGNGDSAKPDPATQLTIADLATTVGEAIDGLGIGAFDLYGSHTGSLTAMELAIQRPQVNDLILAGVTMFDDGDRPDLISRADALGRYLPAYQPTWDGTHLLWAWNFRRSFTLYWPWYDRTPAGIRHVPMVSLDAFHAAFVEFLKSGPTYRVPYRAALEYPTRARLPLLETRTLIGTQADDPLQAYTNEAVSLAPRAVATTLPDGAGDVAAAYDEFLTASSKTAHR